MHSHCKNIEFTTRDIFVNSGEEMKLVYDQL